MQTFNAPEVRGGIPPLAGRRSDRKNEAATFVETKRRDGDAE